jgi:hypothetical protein
VLVHGTASFGFGAEVGFGAGGGGGGHVGGGGWVAGIWRSDGCRWLGILEIDKWDWCVYEENGVVDGGCGVDDGVDKIFGG